MDTLRYYARIYLLIEAQYIKARLQYRADFIISSIGMACSYAVGIITFWVLFTTIPNLAGWSLNELLFMYAFYLLSVTPLQVFFDNIWSLRIKVRDGSFIRYYFRPLNMMFYYVSEVFDIKGLVQFVLGVIVLVYASVQLHLQWTLPQTGLFVVMLLSASLVMISIMVIAASASFWIIDSFPVLALAFKLREFAPYPVTIFDGFFRVVFTYIVPLGFVAFYPAQLFLRPGEASPVVWASPLVGIALFALAYQVWSRGVNHYSGTGS
ncbi:MAG TPA: ABC-2 family transporter protein [Aggregatilineales bacterium]|nr:ABC-2 family transporter protein [Aggregatilineales bacterium]